MKVACIQLKTGLIFKTPDYDAPSDGWTEDSPKGRLYNSDLSSFSEVTNFKYNEENVLAEWDEDVDWKIQ
jgi:hypothetical protein